MLARLTDKAYVVADDIKTIFIVEDDIVEVTMEDGTEYRFSNTNEMSAIEFAGDIVGRVNEALSFEFL